MCIRDSLQTFRNSQNTIYKIRLSDATIFDSVLQGTDDILTLTPIDLSPKYARDERDLISIDKITDIFVDLVIS